MNFIKKLISLAVFIKAITINSDAQNISELERKWLAEKPIIPDKLFNPTLDDIVVHVFLDESGFDGTNLTLESEIEIVEAETEHESELVKLCRSGEFPAMFPIFICPLLYIYSLEDADFPRINLFENYYEAAAQLNNRSNYPCHLLRNDSSEIVGFFPSRIFIGCIPHADTVLSNSSSSPTFFSPSWMLKLIRKAEMGRLMKDQKSFTMSFVMEHPWPEFELCEGGEEEKVNRTHPPCTIQTTFIQQNMLLQERQCCCEGENCARIVHTQRDSLTPILLDIVEIGPWIDQEN